MKEWRITSEKDTEAFARHLARVLRGGHVVGLSGGLGAGKTTLVRYLVHALGGDQGHVSSPTYTLEHEYRISPELQLDHWDLYRVATLPDELYELTGRNTIRVVEWPERCPELGQDLDLLLHFEVVDETGRRVSLEGALADELHARLSGDLA
jgi:tRNA threonylcarbamoyladenosine biosynthesis protein TsaE